MPGLTNNFCVLHIFLGTRETAFVHALSAAAVAHSVTFACSRGGLDKCGCDRSIRGKSQKGFEWAGCSDNIIYGVAFSEKFVDARERLKGKHMVRGLMNVHNNNAGRIVSGYYAQYNRKTSLMTYTEKIYHL